MTINEFISSFIETEGVDQNIRQLRIRDFENEELLADFNIREKDRLIIGNKQIKSIIYEFVYNDNTNDYMTILCLKVV